MSLCLTNEASCHKGVRGSFCTNLRFLDLGSSWRWVVSFTPQPLYSPGKEPRYPLDMRLGGPQSWSDDVEKRTFFTLPGLELRPLCHPACSQSLYRLRCPGSISQGLKYTKL
jgi:hypothetical protein